MGAAAPAFIIEGLTKAHELSSFDCGTASLNEWLQRFAWQNQPAGTAKVYVAHRRDNVVAGYHTLTASSVRRDDAPARVVKGLANHPIGVALLAGLLWTARKRARASGEPYRSMHPRLLMKDLRVLVQGR